MVDKLIMSGMRPTGRLHLGHLAGVVDNWLRFQNEGKCYFEVADWHSLTDRTDNSELQGNITEMATDWLALGIDPQKSTLFVQSLVPEHAELYTLFSMITPITWATHCPVFKDKTAGEDAIKNPSLGLLNYPVLQAADIALYKGTHVPVGEDQAPHVELSRKIIRRFNSLYGNIFPEPETILTKTPRIMGFDGRKMSKSLDNHLAPHHTQEELILRTGKMITDPQKIRKNDPGRPEICSVYAVHDVYNSNRGVVESECKSGARGCVACKRELAGVLYGKFEEFREKRAVYETKPQEVRDILYEGSKTARAVAIRTIEEVRKAMKVKF
ncbi:tryptophan--tRNA ligase [Candidatus Pacearchaeota archaeon CG10_big_fil_rev_8_21_14_0_10_31_24]|nr:MAG: tryptophan--tRNA ligase [Candidatus Pacearchaeota archaeon CG10_big_fil_rev_8_21_14_0_10_31_24]